MTDSSSPSDAADFLTGVNYWPRNKAMYWWSDFDAGEVAGEFDVIGDLGMHVARVFLLWDDWQPDPTLVSTECLTNLEIVCDIAAERDLRLDVTFFTGHMSGPNWAPRWLLDRDATPPSPHVRQVVSRGRVAESSYRNMFTDETALGAERLLVETVVGSLHEHEAIWAWNLSNEPDLFAHPPNEAIGSDWVRTMTELVRSLDDEHPVTTGLHSASLFERNGLRVDHVFAHQDLAVMHGYPMYASWSRGPLDPDFVPFLCSLTTALTGKPCLAEEWGGCTAPPGLPSHVWSWTSYGHPREQFMASEEALATYVESVLPRLVDIGSPGAFLWCFADYAEGLWNMPPCDELGAVHERHFGLLRPDGSLKPHAESLRRFNSGRPKTRAASRTVDLDVTPDEFYSDPLAWGRRLYAEF